MASQPPLFSRLFGPSPIQPIQEHMETCADCVEKLAPYLNAVMTADWSEASSLYNEISELENKADDLKKQIRLGLPRSLFLPVSRTNLLDLVHTQDKIANSAQDVAGRIIGRQLEIPDQIKTEFLAYLDTSLETVRLARRTMSEVSDLINSGFSQQGVETIEEILNLLHSAEHDNDLKQVALRKALFDIEHELNPVNAIFQYNVIDLIADIADQAQTAGNRMMYLVTS